tara:strand:+ start:2869 stop:4161 length:1293 start_codon:yes stop_codon:yes gene_type:complete
MAGNSRTRIISQSKAVFTSPTGILIPDEGGQSMTGNAHSGYVPSQLHRVDTFSFDVDLAGARTDIREFGQLARLGTITMSEVTPSISMGYYLGNGENEARLGFNIGGLTGVNGVGAGAVPRSQFISGIQTEQTSDREKNIYCLTVKEGEDAFDADTFSGTRTYHDVVGFGNCFMTNYTANFAVGEIPRVDLDIDADNLIFYTGQSSGLVNPAIDLQGARADTGFFMLEVPSTGDMEMLVLRPDDVTVSFSNNDFDIGGTNFNDIYAQSVNIAVPLTRDTIEALGNERAVARPIAFPIDVTVSVSALLKQFNDGNLDLILTGTADENQTNITVTVSDQVGGTANKWILQNCVLDSQNFALGLDDNETVDLTFSAQIGGANQQTDGLFMSGAFCPSPTGVASPPISTTRYASEFANINSLTNANHVYSREGR